MTGKSHNHELQLPREVSAEAADPTIVSTKQPLELFPLGF